MVLAVFLLSGTGYLSYRNLSLIVSSIHVDLKPEIKLLRIREISMDLEKAENSIRIYSITNDTLDLLPYYKIISNIDEKVGRLVSECKNDSVLLKQTNTISRLIEENIVIWNELLYLNHNDKVIEYLKQLSDHIDSVSNNAKKQERGILKRVFSRSNKNLLIEQEFITKVQKIEQQDSITKEKLRARESQLARTGGRIKEQFYDLIAKMENEVSGLVQTKAAAANLLAGRTYRWLVMFSISGMLLAILVMFIIIRYVRKTHAYQFALERSKDEAEQLARTKELFMANISHEIRTPVTAISGFTEQLLHRPLDEETERTLKIVKSSSDHLARIIEDILDFSKLQNSKLVLEKIHFGVRKMLEDVYELFKGQAMQNNTRLRYTLSQDTPPVLLGDPYRLKQILINLVSNSVKFTINGEVQFSIDSIKDESGRIDLIMEVRDTGIGIDESKLNLIFEDFTQAEMSTQRIYGGTGLGLSIVKKLVELHNGTIECKSRKNEGTKIICHIPYLVGDEKQLRKDVVPTLLIPSEIKNLKILIVDDEEYNRLLFKTILNRWEIEFREAINGSEALEMLKADHYDLLFMDIWMPGLDGIKTTQFIREVLKINGSEMPVICISATSLNENWQKYQEAGMNAFLQKPFTEEMLLSAILSVIRIDKKIIITGSSSKEEFKSPGSDKINLGNLYRITDGDEQFIKKMLVSYIDTTNRGLMEMQECITSGQLESVASLSHKLLPPCRHIGAMDLCNLLQKIEEGAQNNIDTQIIDTLTRESFREFEAVSELLKERISKIS
jgi:signal transduction histidine kinase/CheY-like chemotaxis protein/HPt (histidine-containing phosphotransfer) domain-containing protein